VDYGGREWTRTCGLFYVREEFIIGDVKNGYFMELAIMMYFRRISLYVDIK
jgi:hypothetical protein